MNSNRIGQFAWATLGFLGGLILIVDLGFGPIVICPRCGGWLNPLLGIVLIAISAAAFVTNRKAVAQTGTASEKE
jgi:hypothetical protein